MAIVSTIDINKYIETRLLGERPHILNRRLPVAHIVSFAKANEWTVAETAENFTLSEAEVLVAMLYYEENKAEIDQQELEEAATFDEIKRQHGN